MRRQGPQVPTIFRDRGRSRQKRTFNQREYRDVSNASSPDRVRKRSLPHASNASRQSTSAVPMRAAVGRKATRTFKDRFGIETESQSRQLTSKESAGLDVIPSALIREFDRMDKLQIGKWIRTLEGLPMRTWHFASANGSRQHVTFAFRLCRRSAESAETTVNIAQAKRKETSS